MNECLPTPCSPLWQSAVSLRGNVLRKPLGLDFSEQEIQEERNQSLLVLEELGLCRACLMLVPLNTAEIKMRQVAVDPDFQGKGLGKKLVTWAELMALEKGFSRMVLHARDTVVPFYQKLGYALIEPGFIEVGIPHHRMEKALLV
jgi:GNAT superfamily N-acetyltransferase